MLRKVQLGVQRCHHTAENIGKLYTVHHQQLADCSRELAILGAPLRHLHNLVQQLARRLNENYRGPQFANRDQNTGKFQVDIVVVPSVTVSPFAGFLLRDYGTDAFGEAREIGILKDHSWNAGAELIWAPTRRTQIMVSYTFDEVKKRIVGGSGMTGIATTTWDSNINDHVHTFTAALKQNVIEDKLDLKLSYVYSRANGSWQTVPFFYNGYVPNPDPLETPNPNYPDTRTSFHRLDALATYRLDPSFVNQMGWKGEALIKVRYAW